MIQFIKFEYRKHTCLVYKDGKHWDAEVSPPNGLTPSWWQSPFRSRFIGRTINKVMNMVDKDIERENAIHERHSAMHDKPLPPKIHS